jgi:GTP-binding protein Era
LQELEPFETLQPEELPPDHRSGFIAVVGRPNVGKSTLLNRLLGQKIAITSPKPQTTRDQLLGILTREDAQLLFMDTPGIHQPKHKLGEYMVAVAEETIEDADVALWLVDVNTPPTEEDRRIADLLRSLAQRKKLPSRFVLGMNKVDAAPMDEDVLEARRQEYLALLSWLEGGCSTAVFSALHGAGTAELVALLRDLLPVGPRYYPAEQVTDVQTRFIVAELIREKALMLLEQEVPHSLAVAVDEFTPRSENMTYISAVIYVERQSQKGIVLGQGGRMIKRIGQAARPEIEELAGTRVYLELWVKVYEKWRRREGLLRRLGYATG